MPFSLCSSLVVVAVADKCAKTKNKHINHKRVVGARVRILIHCEKAEGNIKRKYKKCYENVEGIKVCSLK